MDKALINPNILIKILIEQFYCVIELGCFRLLFNGSPKTASQSPNCSKQDLLHQEMLQVTCDEAAALGFSEHL